MSLENAYSKIKWCKYRGPVPERVIKSRKLVEDWDKKVRQAEESARKKAYAEYDRIRRELLFGDPCKVLELIDLFYKSFAEIKILKDSDN